MKETTEAKEQVDKNLHELHKKVVEHKEGKQEMSVIDVLEAATKIINNLTERVKIYERNMLIADKEIRKLRKKQEAKIEVVR